MEPRFLLCPECDSEVEFYDTAADGKSGRYRCKNKKCGRDTVWKNLGPCTLPEFLCRPKPKEDINGQRV